MKRRCFAWLTMLWCVSLVVANVVATENPTKSTFAPEEKSDLRVLYVGPDPDAEVNVPEYISGPEAERMVELKQERLPAFQALLEEHFEVVKTIPADDYRAEMSHDFDVTIFDEYPPAVRTVELDGWEKSLRLPDDFDQPALMVGEIGPVMLGRFGFDLQIDHL